MIIDCFPYFNEKELLELRIKLLKDKVDVFMITEGDHTHSGHPKAMTLVEELKSMKDIPLEKIFYIPVELPSLEKEPNNWVRERMQRDAAGKYIKEGDIAFISDIDEIINPDIMDYYVSTAKTYRNNILRVPLVFLCSRADLRVHNESNQPVSWDSPFFVMKNHLNKYALSEIRESKALNKNSIVFTDIFITEGGSVQEAGWHFTWMGDENRRKMKLSAFLHSDEVTLDKNYKPSHGSKDPLGRCDHILLKYPTVNLPKILNSLPNVRSFLLPEADLVDAILNEVGEKNYYNWQSHRIFAEWIMKELNPTVTVDLGVDYGFSSFCFAIQNIGTVYGIDCFEGDDMNGSRQTLDYVLNTKDRLGLKNLNIIKGYFDDVVESWNQKIDILHIDGYHRYDSVKNDYEKWSKFVDDNGVILFHDTMVSDPNFEVKKFFDELNLHKVNLLSSNGLGIASKNKSIIDKIKKVFKNDIDEDIVDLQKNKTLLSILEKNPSISTDKNSVSFFKYNDRYEFLQYHSYIENFYESNFAEYRDRKNSILEIGIDTGGSIALWHEYFSNSTILGVDIKKDRLKVEYDEDKFDRAVYAYVKDAYDPTFIKSLGTFDIIIDDGPHTIESQLITVKHYLKKLNSGGILVIEDIATIEGAKQLYDAVPNDNIFTKEIIDLRKKDNRYDSIMLSIKKG